jgi:hypothetical protein
MRRGARHVDRLDTSVAHTLFLEEVNAAGAAMVLFQTLTEIKPNKTDRKTYFHGKYISSTRVKFAS